MKDVNDKLWIEVNSKEMTHLAQCRADNTVPGTNTIHNTKVSDLPQRRKVKDFQVVASYIPTKEGPYQIRWKVGAIKLITSA